jgi:hypothetical protein
VELFGGPEEAPVLAVEDHGPSKIVVLDWKGRSFRVLAGPDCALKAGDRVRPRYDPAKLHRWPL